MNNQTQLAETRPTLTAWHLNERKFQAQGAEHFVVTFAPLPDGTRIVPEDFHLIVSSWQLPSKTTAVETMSYFNGQVKLAGRTTFGELSVNVRDVISYDSASLLELWCAKVNDLQTGLRGFKDTYATEAYVDVYSPNGSQFRRWRYVGVWPSAVSYTALDYDNPGYVQISVTFQYDYAYPDIFFRESLIEYTDSPIQESWT